VFTELARKIDYLDITIRLDSTNKIKTTLFKKPLNLYLYLPPHSAHPPGVLTGLIYGMIRRAYRLTSNPVDCRKYLSKFFTRLRFRGYSKQTLLPLFQAGLDNRLKPPRSSKKSRQIPNDTLFLHVPYHPANHHRARSKMSFETSCYTPKQRPLSIRLGI
jgi:hypothetical protein